MSSPFGVSQINSQPQWSTLPVANGNFSPFPTVGSSIDEVGYGEGGYGEGGYDAPTITNQAAPSPSWVTVLTK